MPQRLHYCIIAYCARETDCPRVHSEAADMQPRLQFYRQFTAARLYDMFKFSSVYSSILKPFQPSQLQPDDSRSRLEQPRQDFHPHGTEPDNSQPTDKCVPRSVGPQRWTQTQDCRAGLGGRDRTEGGPVGEEQEQAGTQVHHGGSSAVSVI